MTIARQEADRILVNFLRNNLTDPNSSRSGEWIYPDFPRVKDLGDNSFPRVGVTILTENGTPLGIYDDHQDDTITFQIDVVAKKGHKLTVTKTDEFTGTMASTSNSNRIVLNNIPNTLTYVKHTTTAYTNLVARNTDSLFTTLTSGTVEWSKSTGNLNFASADVTSHTGEAITATYNLVLEGKKLCQHIAREIVKDIKNNWRTDTTLNGLILPLKINNSPAPFDEDTETFRQMLEYQFHFYNCGEGL